MDRDWSVKAGDLEWDCRRTLNHIANAQFFYATHLATRATQRLAKAREDDSTAPIADLLTVVLEAASVLREVVKAAPPGARAFHPAGMADASGFIAMGCDEILIHTYDITQGFGLPFRPLDDLTHRILARLFPWAPLNVERWDAFRWANGRMALPDRERQGPDWWWHCAPLEEWDGKLRKRTVPPAWR